MSAATDGASEVSVVPAGPQTWTDVETVFGSNGGCEGCWCLHWRVPTGRDYAAVQGAPARDELRRLVRDGAVPGLLAYRDDEPAGWCAVAPRPDYVRLRHSRTLRPDEPDDEDVWALPCFYIRAGHRRRGVADGLLAAAVAFASEHGARTLEAYPNDSAHRRYTAAELHMGTVGLFARHGFTETARPSPGRVIVRRALDRT